MENNVATLRKNCLDKTDKYIDAVDTYIKNNPEALPQKYGDIILSERLVDKGTELNVKIISYCGTNAALNITHDCYGKSTKTETYPLKLVRNGDIFSENIKIRFDIAGNTKFELWANGRRIVRQVAVRDTGYMAVIPWIGTNFPEVNEEIHRFDLPGDFWMSAPAPEESAEDTIKKYRLYIKNTHKYGDRIACFINGKTLVCDSETDCLFELDEETQKRGLLQLDRLLKILGLNGMELVASYTPNSISIKILEELKVKALTSLCAWQNWRDGGWKINHCGVSNQPYYPADDDFRRAGDKRDIMCFTMGNATCNRNYSIMVLDSCPSNAVPGERYFDNRVIHHNAQRFYDAFDGYIADSKNNDKLLTVTIAIESFRTFSDWNAVNEMAIRHMIKKAADEKIIFTSAADVSDYHKKHNLDLQEAYFYQPDFYYGYHNGELPGRVADRIEAVSSEYLAVVKRGSTIPMYFYDYTQKWDNAPFEDTDRNEFGLVNPDTHKPSECVPRQVYTEDMSIKTELLENQLKIEVESKTKKKKAVTGFFDVPFDSDFTISADKQDVKIKKIFDVWTENTHLFIDLGAIESGKTAITITISGNLKEPAKQESINDKFAALWFGEHAYLRCTNKDLAIKVKINAPDNAYIKLINGDIIYPEKGILDFIVNKDWSNEAPVLWGYPKQDFEKALKNAKISDFGECICSRWSGQ